MLFKKSMVYYYTCILSRGTITSNTIYLPTRESNDCILSEVACKKEVLVVVGTTGSLIIISVAVVSGSHSDINHEY